MTNSTADFIPQDQPGAVRPTRRARVGLLWHSVNSDNLGVGALTVADIAIIDAAAAAVGVTPDYLIIGGKDRREPYIKRDDISTKPLRNKDFLKPVGGLLSALRTCDVVIDIGGGDSFADIYGIRRAIWMLASKWMAVALGRPLILAPQTIGPFERSLVRRAAVAVMNRSRLTVTRDALSTAYLDKIGYKGPRLEASDVALKLPYDPPPAREPDGKVRVGLNVSGLLYNGGYSRDNQFGLAADYPKLVRAIVDDLRAKPEVELHFVGHVIAEDIQIEDDQRVCEALAAEFPGAKAAPAFGHPSEAKSYIAGLDFFMGARMHACIAAFSSGVPVLPMAYSRKFGGLFGTLGYDALIDCRSDDIETARAKTAEAYENRAALAALARAKLAEGQAKLDAYGQVISEALDEVAR